MSSDPRHRPRPLPLFTRILGITFAVIALVLTAAFLMLSWQARERLTQGVVSGLELSQRRFGESEVRRKRDRLAQAAVIVELPTLKAAVDTYQSERRAGETGGQLEATVASELEKVQRALEVPALSVTDARGRIIAAVGPLAADWQRGTTIAPRAWSGADPVEAAIDRGSRVYLTTVVPLVLGMEVVGEVLMASPLDEAYARALAIEAGTDVVVLLGSRVLSGTLSTKLGDAIAAASRPEAATLRTDDDEFVVRRLTLVDDATVFAVASVGSAARAAVADMAWLVGLISIGSLLLAAAGSAWLARTLSRPIADLTANLARMAHERRFDDVLAPAGASRELDQLTETFDALRQSVRAAETEAETSYLGVIGALATALDARDRYTAGHSERVATLAVTVGKGLGLADRELDMLRLGALLHDIGKIGVPDAVLRKAGRLTDEEFAQIQLHPTIGARILQPLRLPAEVIAVVELHHERPDGQGYPHGLPDERIPRLAAIVHGADAFDAITSARSYRPGRPVAAALDELRRHAGTGFSLEVVQAITSLPLPALEAATGSGSPLDAGPAGRSAEIVPFRALATSATRRSQGR